MVKTATKHSPPKIPVRPESTREPKKIARRKAKDLSTPSIKDALKGKFDENELSTKEQHEIYSKAGESEEFTKEDLNTKWDLFLERLEDRPNLKSTLSTVPEIGENFTLELDIENTVQEDLINSIKPELVSWLRRELRNSEITLSTRITEKKTGRVIYTDEEKYEEMVKKNPALGLLRKNFNLDFGQ